MNRGKVLLVGILILLLGGMFLGGYIYLKKGKEVEREPRQVELSLDSGKVLEVDEKEFKVGGLEFKIKEAGYFEGVGTFGDDYKLEGEESGSILLVIEHAHNYLDGRNQIDGINLIDANNEVVGNGTYVYDDESLSYSISKEEIIKNKLMLTGPQFLPNEVRKGVMHLNVRDLTGEVFYLILSVNGEEYKIKLNKVDKVFDKKVIDDIAIKSSDIELGKLSGGKILDFDKDVLGHLTIEELIYFKEIEEDFAFDLAHLRSFGGEDGLLVVKVNGGGVSLVDLENLVIEQVGSESSISLLKVEGADDFGEGKVSHDFIKEYGLVDFTDLSKSGDLRGINGNLLYISSRIVDKESYELFDIENEDKRIKFNIN